MNAVTPILPDLLVRQPCDALTTWHQYRSQILEHVATSEFAVTETLSLMSVAALDGSAIKIKPTLHARFEQLFGLLGPEGPRAKKGKAILVPLKAVQDRIELRNLLCHGQTMLYTHSKGGWIARIRMMTVSKGHAILKDELLTEEAVAEALQDLKLQSKMLVARLGQFQKNLTSTPSVTPSAPVVQGSR